MKKELFILTLLLLTFASAQSDAPGLDEAPLVGTIQNLSEGDYSLEANRSNYIQSEWRKTLEKNQAGQVILAVSDFMKNFNPLFKAILGVEYSLSWQFTFAVIMWFSIFVLILHPCIALFGKKGFGIIGAAAVACLVGLAGVYRLFLTTIAAIIKTFWIAALVFVILIIIAILFDKFGGSLNKAIKQAKEKQAAEKTDKDRKVIHTEAEVAKMQLDEYGHSISE